MPNREIVQNTKYLVTIALIKSRGLKAICRKVYPAAPSGYPLLFCDAKELRAIAPVAEFLLQE
jgi:hypothetical protein